MGLRTFYPQNREHLACWVFQAEGIWETVCAGRTLWPSPGASHKPFLCQMPSLDAEEKSILISEDKGHRRVSEQIGLPKCHPPYHTFLRPTVLSHPFSTAFHSSAMLIWKYSDLTVSSGHFLMKAPVSHKTYISKMYNFLLLMYFVIGVPIENLERYWRSSGQKAPSAQQQAKLSWGLAPRVAFPLLAYCWSWSLDPFTLHTTCHAVGTLHWSFLPCYAASHAG